MNEELKDQIPINDTAYYISIHDMAGGYTEYKLTKSQEDAELYINVDLFVYCYDSNDRLTLRNLKKYDDEVNDLLDADPVT